MKNYYFFLILMLGLAAGCSPSVKSEAVDEVNFRDFETFAYLPSGDTVGHRVFYEDRVIKEVYEEMIARGYRLDRQDPDLLVKVHAMYEEDRSLASKPIPNVYDYFGPGFMPPSSLNPYYYDNFDEVPRISGDGVPVVGYTANTFVVDVIRTDTREIIWRGWTDTPVDPLEIDESLRAYVDTIFEEYPVEPK